MTTMDMNRIREIEKLKSLKREPKIIKWFSNAESIFLAILITISIVGMMILWV